jgi:uncharacterized small protein (DUF1192 family)
VSGRYPELREKLHNLTALETRIAELEAENERLLDELARGSRENASARELAKSAFGEADNAHQARMLAVRRLLAADDLCWKELQGAAWMPTPRGDPFAWIEHGIEALRQGLAALEAEQQRKAPGDQ